MVRNSSSNIMERESSRDQEDRDHNRLLRKAVQERDLVGSLDLILRQGVGVEAKDKRGLTLLAKVCRTNHCEVDDDLHIGDPLEAAQFLIDLGAEVNGASKREGTAFLCACEYGHKDMVELLIQHGADLTAKDRNGNTPLHRVVHNNWMNNDDDDGSPSTIANMLIDYGADVNAKNAYGWTPLHNCMLWWSRGNFSLEELLIKSGADINAQDNDGLTPIFYVWQLYQVKWLVENGADMNVKTNDGSTLLLSSCKKQDWEKAMWLIQRGANSVHTRNKNGETSLHYACREGYTDGSSN